MKTNTGLKTGKKYKKWLIDHHKIMRWQRLRKQRKIFKASETSSFLQQSIQMPYTNSWQFIKQISGLGKVGDSNPIFSSLQKVCKIIKNYIEPNYINKNIIFLHNNALANHY